MDGPRGEQDRVDAPGHPGVAQRAVVANQRLGGESPGVERAEGAARRQRGRQNSDEEIAAGNSGEDNSLDFPLEIDILLVIKS